MANPDLVKRSRAFTLVEMLVVVAIIGVLVTLLMSGLRGVKRQADSLVCKSNLRQIAFDFSETLRDPGSLRRIERKYDSSSFGMASFIDRVYMAGAYFPESDPNRNDEYKEHASGEQLFLCPAGGSNLEVHEKAQVVQVGTVQLPQNVSYAFNARLRRVFRFSNPNTTTSFVTRYVRLNENLLRWPMAPKTVLALDVDSRAATRADVIPHEIAPPVEPMGAYMAWPGEPINRPDGKQWFPGRRHDGRTNLALIDGSVTAEEGDMLVSSNSLNWADARYAGQWVDGVYQDDPVYGRKMLESYWSEDSLNKDDSHD